MKMGLHEIDEQIREVENRIAIERIALDDAMHDCASSMRETVTSPKALLALAGAGFAVGKMMFKEKKPEPEAQASAKAKKAGLLGVITGIAGTALSVAGSSRLGWGSVARWAAQRYIAKRRAARAAATGVVPGASYAGRASSRVPPSPAPTYPSASSVSSGSARSGIR